MENPISELRVTGAYSSSWKTPPQSYRMSRPVRAHTALPDTQYKSTCHALTPAMKDGTELPVLGDGRLS